MADNAIDKKPLNIQILSSLGATLMTVLVKNPSFSSPHHHFLSFGKVGIG